MQDRVREMVWQHDAALRPKADALLRTHGQQCFVVTHAGEIVHVTPTKAQAYEFGEQKFKFEEFSVHRLTKTPNQFSGVTHL